MKANDIKRSSVQFEILNVTVLRDGHFRAKCVAKVEYNGKEWHKVARATDECRYDAERLSEERAFYELKQKIETAQSLAEKSAKVAALKASANANLVTLKSVIAALNQSVDNESVEAIKSVLKLNRFSTSDVIAKGEIVYTLHKESPSQNAKALGEYDDVVNINGKPYYKRGVHIGTLDSKRAFTRVLASLKSAVLLQESSENELHALQTKSEIEK